MTPTVEGRLGAGRAPATHRQGHRKGLGDDLPKQAWPQTRSPSKLNDEAIRPIFLQHAYDESTILGFYRAAGWLVRPGFSALHSGGEPVNRAVTRSGGIPCGASSLRTELIMPFKAGRAVRILRGSGRTVIVAIFEGTGGSHTAPPQSVGGAGRSRRAKLLYRSWRSGRGSLAGPRRSMTRSVTLCRRAVCRRCVAGPKGCLRSG